MMNLLWFAGVAVLLIAYLVICDYIVPPPDRRGRK